jgi:CHAT domain-containing protein
MTVPTAGVLDGIVQSRGLVLDELAERRHSAGPGDPKLAALLATANRARQRFANLLVLSMDGEVPKDQLDEARAEKEAAERRLASQSAEARAEMARTATGLAAVLAALPIRAALVSFVQYARSAAPTRGGVGQPTPAPSLVAFVARADRQAPILVPLGSVADVERLISGWRTEAAGATLLASASSGRADAAYRDAGSRLRQAIWDPVAAYLRGADRVFVVPDGAVGLVPLAALPVGATSYLLEQSPPIHYLSAERDLVATHRRPTARASGMLAMGGPSFDDRALSGGRTVPANDARAAGDAMTRGIKSGCVSLQSLRFQPLDGTLQEVQELSTVWTGSAGATSDAARFLVGSQASEIAFKQDAPRHRVLHLATHGFFLNGDCAPTPTGTRGVGGLTSAGPRRTAENPLLLSGLALAGANRRASAAPDEDDGILTAEEVASLDLSGVEWAVLSACDTGVGEIRAGEGVFGLRRAFQVAGARTVVMSLWSVDDQATRAWMRALYEGRFQRKLSTADAVHEASLSMLRDRRAKGLSTHPFYWAAFVAAGDWR